MSMEVIRSGLDEMFVISWRVLLRECVMALLKGRLELEVLKVRTLRFM